MILTVMSVCLSVTSQLYYNDLSTCVVCLSVNRSVCYVSYVSVPDEGHNVRKVHPVLQGYEVEVDQIGCWPELVHARHKIEVFLWKSS